MEIIRVLLVDDHTLVRKGIANILSSEPDMEVVGEAADGEEALEQVRNLAPDVVLMDIYMPGCDGLTATRLIKQEKPGIKIIILTVSDDDQNLFEAIKAGAQGYLLKKIEPRELCEMVRSAYRGEASISRSTAARIMEEFARLAQGRRAEEGSAHLLTRREKEVLSLVAEGLGNKQVAQILCISENTVRNHLRNILEKLHLQNRVEAATYAIRAGLVPNIPPKIKPPNN